MAITDSIMSIFRPAQQVTTPALHTMHPAAPAPAPAPAPVPSSAPDAILATPAPSSVVATPPDNFDTLWQADTTNPPVPAASLVPTFNLDPANMMAVARTLNFTAHIPPELVTKAMGGDAAAFLEVINQAGQLGFANAATASGKFIEHSMNNAQNALTEKVLPTAIRQQAIDAAITASNPIFRDPSVAPMLGMLKSNLAAKYPQASPQEIADTAARFLQNMSQKVVTSSGGTIVQNNQAPNGQRNGKTEDWEAYLSN